MDGMRPAAILRASFLGIPFADNCGICLGRSEGGGRDGGGENEPASHHSLSVGDADQQARKALGDEVARLFRGQVADMRQAMFLGELPDDPEVLTDGGRLALNYPLGETVVLEVEPIGVGQVSVDNWRDVHRVKLVRIHENGTR
jgi:hypothetical protein